MNIIKSALALFVLSSNYSNAASNFQFKEFDHNAMSVLSCTYKIVQDKKLKHITIIKDIDMEDIDMEGDKDSLIKYISTISETELTEQSGLSEIKDALMLSASSIEDTYLRELAEELCVLRSNDPEEHHRNLSALTHKAVNQFIYLSCIGYCSDYNEDLTYHIKNASFELKEIADILNDTKEPLLKEIAQNSLKLISRCSFENSKIIVNDPNANIDQINRIMANFSSIDELEIVSQADIDIIVSKFPNIKILTLYDCLCKIDVQLDSLKKLTIRHARSHEICSDKIPNVETVNIMLDFPVEYDDDDDESDDFNVDLYKIPNFIWDLKNLENLIVENKDEEIVRIEDMIDEEDEEIESLTDEEIEEIEEKRIARKKLYFKTINQVTLGIDLKSSSVTDLYIDIATNRSVTNLYYALTHFPKLKNLTIRYHGLGKYEQYPIDYGVIELAKQGVEVEVDEINYELF
ncbi:hypothetical protein FZC35_01775 [Candidatus Cytomitobacter indipagum]|uniref:Uncharacterized protein n=1 Tax=Candidatus Cytomitobacter indipagum TaxID=2601575 RepID=A0A5C0UDN4_9PROT|nr:hypothetical protein [Candidatus Cytomitobacter indipagum]QEK38098.1 hypothetical protein FZC35_01775 [Candidatus Cytomitobacter indipagum]